MSRNTVMQAVEQLAAEGYLGVSRNRRPVVAPGASLSTPPRGAAASPGHPTAYPLSDWGLSLARGTAWPPAYPGRPRAFQPGLADEREFPHDIWGRCLRHAAAHAPGIGRAGNAPVLREALLGHLGAHRGIRAHPDQVFILPSAQAGLVLTARATTDAGDIAWMESPGYGGARAALSAAGARVVGMPIDSNGLVIDPGQPAPRMIFATPSHQYPTGRLMPIGRRLELIRFARDAGAAIIEDDYDGDFHYEGRPVAALASIDPGACVFYLGTFSKVMSADIRVGYVVVPRTLVPVFEAAQRHLGLFVGTAMQVALAEFIGRGIFLSHIRRMTRLYRQRRDALVRALEARLRARLTIEVPAGGMQLLARCDDKVDDAALARRLLGESVTVRALSEMLYHDAKERGLFLGFAAWNAEEIDMAVGIIARQMT